MIFQGAVGAAARAAGCVSEGAQRFTGRARSWIRAEQVAFKAVSFTVNASGLNSAESIRHLEGRGRAGQRQQSRASSESCLPADSPPPQPCPSLSREDKSTPASAAVTTRTLGRRGNPFPTTARHSLTLGETSYPAIPAAQAEASGAVLGNMEALRCALCQLVAF